MCKKDEGCKNCGKPLTGRQRSVCSDKCRMALKRANKTHEDCAGAAKSNKPEQICPPEPEQSKPEQPKANKGVTPDAKLLTLVDYMTHPERYAKRERPERLNWGPYMTKAELEQAGLKANRVPIPGDWDYAGVCVETEQGWTVA